MQHFFFNFLSSLNFLILTVLLKDLFPNLLIFTYFLINLSKKSIIPFLSFFADKMAYSAFHSFARSSNNSSGTSSSIPFSPIKSALFPPIPITTSCPNSFFRKSYQKFKSSKLFFIVISYINSTKIIRRL